MAKINRHIEIVRSSISGIMSMSQKSCDIVRNVLELHFEHVGVTTVNSVNDLEVLVAKQPDLVFLGVKYIPLISDSRKNASRKVWVSTYLDMHGVSHTGSNGAAVELDYDKAAAKRVVRNAGLSTPMDFLAKTNQYIRAAELPLAFPLFIKPPTAGGGRGIGADSVVRDFAAYEQKVQAIYDDCRSDALVEEYLTGREFSVAILRSTDSKELTAMPLELITEQNNQGDRVLGKAIKVADTELVTSIRDEYTKRLVVELALGVFEALGARDYGRIDIRLDAQGVPHFIEANLVPGLTRGYFMRACRINQAMSYESTILRIVELGLSHNLDYPKDAPEPNALGLVTLPALTGRAA